MLVAGFISKSQSSGGSVLTDSVIRLSRIGLGDEIRAWSCSSLFAAPVIVISSVGNPVRDTLDEGVASPDQNFLYLVTVREGGGGVGDFSRGVGDFVWI
jgi:hypothetical protein